MPAHRPAAVPGGQRGGHAAEVLEQEPVPPRQLNAAVDATWKRSASSAWKKSRRALCSAAALADDLERYLEGAADRRPAHLAALTLSALVSPQPARGTARGFLVSRANRRHGRVHGFRRSSHGSVGPRTRGPDQERGGAAGDGANVDKYVERSAMRSCSRTPASRGSSRSC